MDTNNNTVCVLVLETEFGSETAINEPYPHATTTLPAYVRSRETKGLIECTLNIYSINIQRVDSVIRINFTEYGS